MEIPQGSANPWKRKTWNDVVSVDMKYRDKERIYPEIYVWRRTPAGKTMSKDPDVFPSYFYVPVDEVGKISTMDLAIRPDFVEYPGIKSLNGVDVAKLGYNKFNKELFTNARNHFEKTFEDDVRYIWRYLIDNEVKFSTKRRVCYFDIETDMSLDIKNTPAPILSISVYDSQTDMGGIMILDNSILRNTDPRKIDENRFIVSYKTEEGLLQGFLSWLKIYNPDILCAYNLIEFDFPYLVNRMEKLDIDFRAMSETRNVYALVDEKELEAPRCYCGGRELMDWYVLVKKLYDEDKPEDYRLDTVAETILGRKKISHPYKDVGELYRKNRELFIKYNMEDVYLLRDLEAKVGLIMRYMISLQQLIPMPLEQLKANSVALDFYILKTYQGKKIFPSKRNREHKRFKGALTGKFYEDDKGRIHSTNPEKRMFHNIGVLDFSGMYPNIFRSFNISPETVCIQGEPNSVEIEGKAFTQDFEGLMPALVKNIMDLRAVYTKQLEELDPNDPAYAIAYNLQYGVKRLNNSLYGATGYSGFRLFDLRVAEAITSLGQLLITKVYKYLKDELGYETIYQDTDSVFIPLKCEVSDHEATEKEIAFIEDSVNVMIERLVLSMGSSVNYMKMDFEKRFTKVIFLGVKKRYLGLADLWKGKWLPKKKFVIKGYDLVRRELPKDAKSTIKTVILSFLEGETVPEIRTKYLSNLTDIKKKDIHDIALSRGIGKDIHQYQKTTPQHIKAAIAGQYYFGINFKKGDHVKIMFVKNLPYINSKKAPDTTDVIGFMKDTRISKRVLEAVDYKRFFDTCIRGKLRMFYGTAGMKMEDVLNEHQTLGEFITGDEIRDDILKRRENDAIVLQ